MARRERSHLVPAWLALGAVFAACSASSTTSEPAVPLACDGGCDAAADDASSPSDAATDAAPDPVDAARKIGPTLPGPNACGICDRVWICNGFSQTWKSDGENCTNSVNQTSLHCDGSIHAPNVGAVGQWKGDDQLLKLSYTGLNGESFIYACIPPPA